jgi:hypothetical protein
MFPKKGCSLVNGQSTFRPTLQGNMSTISPLKHVTYIESIYPLFIAYTLGTDKFYTFYSTKVTGFKHFKHSVHILYLIPAYKIHFCKVYFCLSAVILFGSD